MSIVLSVLVVDIDASNLIQSVGYIFENIKNKSKKFAMKILHTFKWLIIMYASEA